MKKILSLLTALLCLLAALPAWAEEAEPFVLEGVIVELSENGFLLEDTEVGSVEVLLSEDTQLLGDLAEPDTTSAATPEDEAAEPSEDAPEEEMDEDTHAVDAEPDEAAEDDQPADVVANAPLTLAVGQYVIVTYNGQMTRSLPPQVTAQTVRCFIATGIVSELTEESLMLSDEKLGDVLVMLSDTLPQVWEGGQITVYFDGVMTASLPAQINAKRIEVPSIMGEMSDLTEESFLLTDDSGEIWEVLLTDETSISGDLAEGDRVRVVFGGETSVPSDDVPAQLTAYAVQSIAR